MGPVVRILQAEVLRLDRGHRRGDVARRDLLEAAAGRIAARDVEVDLQRTAGPAGLGLADRLARGRAAVRRLRPGEQAHLDERLARVDGEELRREAVVGGDEGRRVLAHQLAGTGQDVVGLFVGGANERLAGGDAAVLDAVEVDIVERRVRRAVRQLRRHEPEELMLELVRRRHAGEEQVRVVLLDDVLEHRLMTGHPVQALLDVRLLGHDARLEDGEVGRGRGRERLREVLREVAGEARLAGPRRPARDRTADGGVEEADTGEVPRQLLDPDEHAGRQAGRGAADDLDLDVGPLALAEDADAVGRALRPREEDLVVVGRAVVRAVEDPGVEPVLVDAEVEHAEPHLHGRAERRRQ